MPPPKYSTMNNEALTDHSAESFDQSKSNRFLLIALPIGHLVNDWPGAALWILAPAIALSMGLGPVEVGLLLTIHAAGASLAYLPAGLVGDMFRNRGNLLAITFWWVAIGYFVASGATNFWVLAFLLGFAGLGDAAWHPWATGVMVQQMPARRAQVIGVHALGGTLAEVAGPLCAGLLLGFFEWQTVLQISTLPAFIMAVIFLKYRKLVPVSKETRVTKQDLSSMVSTWLRGSSLRIIAIIVLYNMSLMGAMAMMPLYLQESFALTPAQTGFVFAIIWTVGALAQPLLGHLSDLTGRKTVSIVGLLLASVFFVAAIFASNLIGLVVVLVLSMGALVGIRAVLLAAMVDVSGKRESTTLGFAFAVMDGVGALGAVFAGIAGQYDLRYAFAFSAVMAASAMALTVLHKFSKA